ncbi:hypothetical protein HDU79_005360 [Rhizoclosmatium sp. JEL0117]|nr:hypothetical protein HDU79_005360 [Rhizoclosmatium sp. JEL0117]
MTTATGAPIEEIKEFHFHLYWMTQSKTARANAESLLDLIHLKNKEGYFIAKPLRINEGPVGPHPMSSCEVWVPIESFGRFYGWVSQVRPADVTLMIHPLSKMQVLDHTERIAFMGAAAPLYIEALGEAVLSEAPAQYPELGVGYSKRED